MNKKSTYRSFTGKDLSGILAESKGRLILLIFTMEWLGINSMLEAFLLDLMEDRKGISIYQIDVEKNDHLAVEMGVSDFPHTLFLKNKEVIDSFVGLISKKKISLKLDLHTR